MQLSKWVVTIGYHGAQPSTTVTFNTIVSDARHVLCCAACVQGLDVLAPQLLGNLARPRRFEIAAAINRIRTLQMTQQQQLQAGPAR
jgi:hypothetical protein